MLNSILDRTITETLTKENLAAVIKVRNEIIKMSKTVIANVKHPDIITKMTQTKLIVVENSTLIAIALLQRYGTIDMVLVKLPALLREYMWGLMENTILD